MPTKRQVLDLLNRNELIAIAEVVRGDDGHSPAFWAQLGRVMPDYDARRDALKALGPSLEW